MNKYSKYNLKKDLKITYLVGAGASFSSIPIWSEQSASMIQVAESIKNAMEHPKSVFLKEIMDSPSYKGFNEAESSYLYSLIDELNYFAKKAMENKTIDSYAYILFNQKNESELNRLKRTLSIYLDIWQFYQDTMTFRSSESNPIVLKDKIDKRYIQWLNLITQSNTPNDISKKENVNILSWNYDLQVELAYANMYPENKFNCLSDINSKFKFLSKLNQQDLDISHLNGHHGFFNYDNEYYSTGISMMQNDYYLYLKNLYENTRQFKLRHSTHHNYGLINFSWEKGISNQTIEIASQTDILIIIGYSFPQYNRIVDTQIIDAVKTNNPLYIYYQDPSDTVERVKRLINYDKFEHDKSTDEFFIPDEFLYPKETEVYV